jgi:hypothetical protein
MFYGNVPPQLMCGKFVGGKFRNVLMLEIPLRR